MLRSRSISNSFSLAAARASEATVKMESQLEARSTFLTMSRPPLLPIRSAPLLIRLLILAGFCSAMMGCASLRPSDYHQAVLIRSEPPGAEILQDGELLGHTPEYVRLRRGYAPEVEVRALNQTTSVKLSTKYRWGSSFFSNMIFYIAAPLGWSLDLLTGNAWNIQDSPVVEVASIRGKPLSKPKPLSYAIAPPQAESLELSDDVGHTLEELLRVEKGSPQILDYDKTLPIFVGQGFDFDGVPDPENRRNTYHLLKTTGVYESKLETKNDRTTLTVHPYNALSKTYGTEVVYELASDEYEAPSIWNWHNWLRLLPNTVTLDSTSDQMIFSLSDSQGAEQSVQLGSKHGQDQWNQILNAVTAVNLTNLPIRRSGRASRIQFSFVPAVHLSHSNLQVEKNPNFQDTAFTRTWISAGYGAELGWQLSRNYLYFNIVPLAYWNRIDWSANQAKQSRTGVGISLQTEIGYLYFITDHWNVSLFTRSFNEDNRTWGRALASASGQSDYSAGTLTRTVVGLSAGYRFGTSSKIGHWIHSQMGTESTGDRP